MVRWHYLSPNQVVLPLFNEPSVDSRGIADQIRDKRTKLLATVDKSLSVAQAYANSTQAQSDH